VIYAIFAALCIVIYLLYKIANNQSRWCKLQHEWLVQIYDRMKK